MIPLCIKFDNPFNINLMENYNYWTASHWNSVQSNSFTCSKLIFKLWAYRVVGLTCGLLSCARTWQHVKIQYWCNYLAIKLGFTSHAKQLISSTISIIWNIKKDYCNLFLLEMSWRKKYHHVVLQMLLH